MASLHCAIQLLSDEIMVTKSCLWHLFQRQFHLPLVVDFDLSLHVDSIDDPAARLALLDEIVDPVDTVHLLKRHNDAKGESVACAGGVAGLGFDA